MNVKGNNLSDSNIVNLLDYSKDKDEIAKIIVTTKGNNLSDENIYNLLGYGTNVNEIVKILIQNIGRERVENLIKLFDINIKLPPIQERHNVYKQYYNDLINNT